MKRTVIAIHCTRADLAPIIDAEVVVSQLSIDECAYRLRYGPMPTYIACGDDQAIGAVRLLRALAVQDRRNFPLVIYRNTDHEWRRSDMGYRYFPTSVARGWLQRLCRWITAKDGRQT